MQRKQNKFDKVSYPIGLFEKRMFVYRAPSSLVDTDQMFKKYLLIDIL